MLMDIMSVISIILSALGFLLALVLLIRDFTRGY